LSLPPPPELSKEQEAIQSRLRAALQAEANAKKLETLCAALVGRLLKIEIAVAGSGFQHGADAGPAGRQDRRFRLECKKYQDNTALGERELLGEIDQALVRDEAIEAWLLAATRSVAEQLQQSLTQHGDRLGVPVLIFGWQDHGVASLAALCASAPDLVADIFSTEAGDLAGKLAPCCGQTIAQIERDLQSWSLGFETLRCRSHAQLVDIWTKKPIAVAKLGQDAAGGAQPKHIRRYRPHEALGLWWRDKAQKDAPVAVVGAEGVGKTWATLDWLVDSRVLQPIVLVVPSAATSALQPSESSIKRFLAEQLYEVARRRDVAHWLRRVDRLLERPIEEGPVFTLFLDGLNQESSTPWLSLLKALQGPAFGGRVRVIVSARPHYLTEKLSGLKGLVERAVEVKVDAYDIEPGGELDKMLALEGLARSNLHPDLIDLARTPRLFKLVVKLREQLVDAGKVTVHRLLWEYGRDTFGDRAGKSFSEAEWREWLQTIAERFREGVKDFSVSALSETTHRSDLGPSEVYARLSDIIDGNFTLPTSGGRLEFTPTVVSHALAVALLDHLGSLQAADHDKLEEALSQWLDPISGLDQRAEILRAGVSIVVERGEDVTRPIAGVLVTAWLQTQNLADHHRQELIGLAASLPDALMDAIQRSSPTVQASARASAIQALRAIPRADQDARAVVVARCSRWIGVISRDIRDRGLADAAKMERQRAERLIGRVGADRSGPMTVLGLAMDFRDFDDGSLIDTIPSLIEGYELSVLVSLLEVAAINATLSRHSPGWDGFKWLVLLNEVDPDQTASALRDRAAAVQIRPPESGVNPALPGRIAERLLWLTGLDDDDAAAQAIDSHLESGWSYEKDYLPDPAGSFFALERRHADEVLRDRDRTLYARLQRTKAFWVDPSFEPPADVIDEVRAMAAAIDVAKLDVGMGHTAEDHNFEEIAPILARCAPDLLADIARRKLLALATSTEKQRYWRAHKSTEYLLLNDQGARDAARTLRATFVEPDAGNEFFAASELLLLELEGEDALTQAVRLIEANLDTLRTDYIHVLKAPNLEQATELVDRFGAGSPKQRHDLLLLFSLWPVDFGDRVWNWLVAAARERDDLDLGVAFRTLERIDSERFGRLLLDWNWNWKPDHPFWANHYGSGALISAGSAMPFDQIVPRLAPWRLLEAARRRGSDPAEVRLATAVFGEVLRGAGVSEPDPGSDLAVDLDQWSDYPSFYHFEIRREASAEADPLQALRGTQNIDARRQAWKRAAETAKTRIQEARLSGANLYLAHVGMEDFSSSWLYAREQFTVWLEGMAQDTGDFKRRVRLAESVYLSLCEVLLDHAPDQGVDLWKALRRVMTIRYTGAGGVDELLHIAFRAKPSPAVSALRAYLLDLDQSPNDQALDELAFVAGYNGQETWIESQIEADRASPLAWRKKRSHVLAGGRTGNRLPVDDAWSEGRPLTTSQEMLRRAAKRQFGEATARHWWQAYLHAQSMDEAYAAWTLFLTCCDRRIWSWIRKDTDAVNDKGEFFQRKIAHAELNKSLINRRSDDHNKSAKNELFGRQTVGGIGPWDAEHD
jgi:hypothetical protein